MKLLEEKFYDLNSESEYYLSAFFPKTLTASWLKSPLKRHFWGWSLFSNVDIKEH